MLLHDWSNDERDNRVLEGWGLASYVINVGNITEVTTDCSDGGQSAGMALVM